MRKTAYYCGLLFLMACGGCESFDVYVDYNPNTDFSTFKTYYWAPTSEKEKDNLLQTDTILDARVRNIVEKQLSDMGYTKQTSQTPDFYVGALVTVENKTSNAQVNNYYAYGRDLSYYRRYPVSGHYNRSSQYTYHYQQGTLVIDIADAKSRDLIWRGVAEGEVNQEQRDQKEQDERLTELVARMFKDFPPETEAVSSN